MMLGGATTLMVLVVGAAVAAAQMDHDHGSSMAYDPKTEVTLQGTVQDVMTMPGTQPMSGVHLSLETKDGTIHVHVGTPEYLAKQNVSFAKGDRVTVTGSKIKGEGFEAVLARSVAVGEVVVALREKDGTPRWTTGA
jgi:hypothetical protein